MKSGPYDAGGNGDAEVVYTTYAAFVEIVSRLGECYRTGWRIQLSVNSGCELAEDANLSQV
jgi:hypothetical protein